MSVQARRLSVGLKAICVMVSLFAALCLFRVELELVIDIA